MPIATDFGEFSTEVYEAFQGPFAGTIQVGANIKLLFQPKDDLPAIRRIALIQFKNVMSPPQGPRQWLVDRMSAANNNPFFGYGANWTPSANANMAGAESLHREPVTCRSGSVVKRTHASTATAAYLVDTPREIVTRPGPTSIANGTWTNASTAGGARIFTMTSYFTVYAVNLDPNPVQWFGGVSWGYTVTWNTTADSAATAVTALALAGRKAPAGNYNVAPFDIRNEWNEAQAARRWESALHETVPAW
jgi:hypothetical protein